MKAINGMVVVVPAAASARRAIRVRGAGCRGLCITEFDGRMD